MRIFVFRFRFSRIEKTGENSGNDADAGVDAGELGVLGHVPGAKNFVFQESVRARIDFRRRNRRIALRLRHW